MKIHKFSIVILALLTVGITAVGCIPEPCVFTANASLTAYRLPDDTSDVFGVIGTGETFEVLAQTADGWVGFDPGIAQAGNIGLARHRWVLPNATVSPSCLADVDLVTLADVEADLAASGQ